MAENTKIEWADHTYNAWFGCTKVSPACDHCYAEELMDHRYGKVEWGAGKPRTRASESTRRAPFKWDRAAALAGKPASVFCLSLGDIWDNEVDASWRAEAFDVMRATPHLVYLLLSKRIGNAVDMARAAGGLPPNAALGSTTIDQLEWDRDVVKLKDAAWKLGAMFTFTSIEPMLGAIRFGSAVPDWVIVGGESGAHARPMHPDWVRGIRDQCDARGVSFIFKQWGNWAPDPNGNRCVNPHGRNMPNLEPHGSNGDGTVRISNVGKVKARRLLDGVEHNGFPPQLQRST